MAHTPIRIRGTEVERVTNFKFLGVHISEDLSWTLNTSTLTMKIHQRLSFLRRLKKIHLSPQILTNCYRCTIESILTNCVTVWYANCSVSERQALQRVVKSAQHITGSSLSSIEAHQSKRCLQRARSIIKDFSNPNHRLFTLLPSRRHYRSLCTQTSRNEDFRFLFTYSDLQVRVNSLQASTRWAELKCHSSRLLRGRLHYVWYKNGRIIQGQTSSYCSVSFTPTDSFSCAVEGHENCRSPPLYAPKLPSVSVSPSAEIVEGSSVTLTCSSDANPAANYTWYKNKGNPDLHSLSKEPQLVFSSIQSSDSGEYYCTAENELWGKVSKYIYINVKLIQGQDGWGVTYSSTEICALKGSTVDMSCTYRYPSWKYGRYTEVKETFWFTKLSGKEPVDLRTDSDYQECPEC
ncbi:uncharacterized protein LOC115588634 [Sparus aurata]|uniref:uncharacterized protein LOC115588634 n=1 Tax=Sparus aurata TaxID=8175 RepID=UPI0011C10F35|nr:uncharacterized protein LOC115588634 [Sparus aurata]